MPLPRQPPLGVREAIFRGAGLASAPGEPPRPGGELPDDRTSRSRRGLAVAFSLRNARAL